MANDKVDLRSKDDLVERLRMSIDKLSYFIRIAEEIAENKSLSPQVQEFIEVLKDIRMVPDELGSTPLLIEETIKFVEGIVGEVHLVRVQIENSFSESGALKTAVQTLDLIPDSTLRATDQILNTLDNIMAREGEMSEIINQLTEKKSEFDETMQGNVDRLQEIFTENQNEHFAIMDALQFQDITTQQIQHVNDLLENTEKKLNELALKLKGLDEADIRNIIKAASKPERVYDPNAEFKHRESEQNFADELYEQKETMKQDDIESLLSQFGK